MRAAGEVLRDLGEWRAVGKRSFGRPFPQNGELSVSSSRIKQVHKGGKVRFCVLFKAFSHSFAGFSTDSGNYPYAIAGFGSDSRLYVFLKDPHQLRHSFLRDLLSIYDESFPAPASRRETQVFPSVSAGLVEDSEGAGTVVDSAHSTALSRDGADGNGGKGGCGPEGEGREDP